MQSGDIPKQRGIYSEILTTEDTDNLKVNIINELYNIVVGFNYRSITKQCDLSELKVESAKGIR